MKIYSPTHLTPKQGKNLLAKESEILAGEMNVSDETLIQYASRYVEIYRETIDKYFPNIAPFLSTYTGFPYKIDIVRLDKNGVNIFYKKSDKSSVDLIRWQDITPPVDFNFFELVARFSPSWSMVDFSVRSYNENEARMRAMWQALDDALQVFWLLLDAKDFEEIAVKLIKAETENDFEAEEIKNESKSDSGVDLELKMILREPARFNREENWGFLFKHFKENRITPKYLNEIESSLKNQGSRFDAICLVTSGDVTSIGKEIAIQNPKIRIWDRTVLNLLAKKHLAVINEHLKGYENAIQSISEQLEEIKYKRFEEFKGKLQNCPLGQKGFTQYELICKEILEYVFIDKLKPYNNQITTADGTQRRDIIFRNLRTSEFFERIFTRFNADFIIFDPKNYQDEIGKDEFISISQYPNEALGDFAVLISRKGASEQSLKTQSRIFRGKNPKVILSISDSELLEMVLRKERGENPEDVLSDLLDKLLLDY